MKQLKMMILGSVAAVACCAGGAGTALAEGGPLFGFCELVTNGGNNTNTDCDSGTSGTGQTQLLQADQTLRVLASALNLQLLRTASNVNSLIACTSLSLNSGAYLEGGMPGQDREQITYSGCVTPNKPSCEVSSQGEPNGKIATLALESELVYLEKGSAEELNPTKSGTLFKPANATETFAIIELKPSGSCPITGSPAIKGLTIRESLEPLVHQLLKTVLAPTTPIKKYFVGMTGEERTIRKLEFAGVEVTYSGKVSLDVTLLGKPYPIGWWICP